MKQLGYQILTILYNGKFMSPLYGTTVQEVLDSGMTVTRNTISTELKKLVGFGYVEKGLKRNNSHTYYITELGINFKNDLENF